MFTIYIHILEVLAGHLDGANCAKVADMSGGLLTERKARSHMRDLQREGFVVHHDTDPDGWMITEKALEYCETVVKKRDNETAYRRAIAKNDEYIKQSANPYVGVVPGAWEELPQDMIISGDYVFSVDENGVPDHAYIGLANEDGSLPFDAIVTPSENMASEGAKEGFLEPSEMTQVEKLPELISSQPNDLFDDGDYDIVGTRNASYLEADDLGEEEECYECGAPCNYHMDWCPRNYA